MRIATYNVNGINGRLPNLLEWLKEADVACLQELKAPDDKFPEAALHAAGLTRSGICTQASESTPSGSISGTLSRDAGLRVDHLLLSPPLARRLTSAGVDREVRGREHASDHAPAWIAGGVDSPIGKSWR